MTNLQQVQERSNTMKNVPPHAPDHPTRQTANQILRSYGAVVGPQDKQVITHYGLPTLLTIAQ